MYSSKYQAARRASDETAARGVSVPAGKPAAKSVGGIRISTASNSVASCSAPEKISSWVRSAGSDGET